MTIGVVPASAAEIGNFSEVSLLPSDGVAFSVDGRSYSGSLRVRAMSDGLALVEEIGIDGYLAGVREVPATWPEAALDAQAVAARTYLAWTLARGRSTAASRYDFDICATTQCQVYAGTAAGEPEWVQAVARTAGEVLLYQGSPAQTMYFSTSGGWTEPIQDIFDGASAKPYLVGVLSPDETSPLVEWTVSMPASVFIDVLEAGGYLLGDVRSVAIVRREQGEGVWNMEVGTAGGNVRVPVADVRRIFNRFGPSLYPDLFPGRRPDAVRYPQSILSYRFEVTYRSTAALDGWLSAIPADDRPVEGSVVFRGNGWGHHVGMSQYGALAMADKGEDYASILAHYYGGLRPTVAEGATPAVVSVGLSWGDDNLVIRADGPFAFVADGRQISVAEGGTWIFSVTETGTVGVLSGDLLLDRFLSRFGGLVT